MVYIKSTGFLKPGYTSGKVNFDEPIIRPYLILQSTDETAEFIQDDTFVFNVNIPQFSDTSGGSGHGTEFKFRVTYDAQWTNTASMTIKFWHYDLAGGFIEDLDNPVWTFDTPATGGTDLWPRVAADDTSATFTATAKYKESTALHSGGYLYCVTDAPGSENATRPFSISVVHP